MKEKWASEAWTQLFKKLNLDFSRKAGSIPVVLTGPRGGGTVRLLLLLFLISTVLKETRVIVYLQNVGLYLDQSLGTLPLFSTLIGIKNNFILRRVQETHCLKRFREIRYFLFWFVGTERVRAMGD